MTMNELTGKTIKIGKTSITVKDEAEKTRGVVRNILAYSQWSDRECFEHNKTICAAGALERKNIVLDRANNTLYYLNNLRTLKNYEKYFVGREGYEQEEKAYNNLKMAIEKAKENMQVIDCYII